MEENPINDPQEPPRENEIANYYEDVKKMEMQGYESGIKKARNALFVTAGLLLLGEVLSASMNNIPWTPLLIGIVVIEVGIFVALGLWTKTKPFSAIVTGLVLFVLYWIFTIVFVNKEAAYKGIIVRVIIIVILAQALKPAKAWEDTKKTM